jgi:hypothetical protein
VKNQSQNPEKDIDIDVALRGSSAVILISLYVVKKSVFLFVS